MERTVLWSLDALLGRQVIERTHVFEARRIGPRALLIEPNYEFRAITDNTAEARAVRDAFAPSVRWGFDIVARHRGPRAGGRQDLSKRVFGIRPPASLTRVYRRSPRRVGSPSAKCVRNRWWRSSLNCPAILLISSNTSLFRPSFLRALRVLGVSSASRNSA